MIRWGIEMRLFGCIAAAVLCASTTLGLSSQAGAVVAAGPVIDAPFGGETIRRVSPPGTAAGHSGAGTVGAFGAVGTLSFAPAPYASASATNNGYSGQATGTYYFGVKSTNGFADEIPIIVHYTLRLQRPDLTLGADTVSLAQLSVHSVNILSGVDRAATFQTDCTYCEVIGVGYMHVLPNDYTNYVTLTAVAKGAGVTAFADPFIEIDPTYASIDPNYLTTTSIFQSAGVSNAEAPDPSLTGVPEPASLALLLGMIGAGATVRRRRAA